MAKTTTPAPTVPCFFPLTGSAKILALFRLLAAVACVILPGLSHGQTATDECGFTTGAEYTVGATCAPSAFNKPATFVNDMTPTGCGAGAYGDAFGWFTGTGNPVIVKYTPPAAADAVMHVFSGTCAAPVLLGCSDNCCNGAVESVTLATTLGTQYFVRVQRYGASTVMNGTLCVYAAPPPPANDEPCGAVALTVNTNLLCTTQTTGSLANATPTSGVITAPCNGTPNDDVWYKFTATATVHTVSLNNVAGNYTDMYMALYSGACGALTNIGCSDPNSTTLSGLTVGNTYWVRVYSYSNSTAPTTTFKICVGTPPPPPANDDPCAPVVLTVNASCVNTNSTTLYATGTTGPPAPTCANYQGGDVWFRVTVPAGGAFNLTTTAGTLTDGGMAAYTNTGGCLGTFTQIACNDDANGAMPALSLSGLAAGVIYVRVWEYGNDAPGTFSICATLPPAAPANDNPCTAAALTVNPTFACAAQTAGTLTSATATTGVATAPCNGTPNDDVWFTFTATGPSHRISLNNISGSPTDLYMSVYSGTCGALTNIACSDPETMTLNGLTAGVTYWVRVYSYSNSTSPTTTFNVCVGTPPPPPPPPANDNPCTAAALTVNPTFACAAQTAGTLVGATATTGVATAPCYGTPNDDVWFTFTATGPVHRISLNNILNTPTDLYISVYSGTCGALTNIACSDPETLTLTNLTAGTTYWVRVYSYTNSAAPTTTFNVCVGTPPPPPTCGQVFYDNGGASGNYVNYSDDVVTICPTIPGNLVTLTFSSFNVDTYDDLTIYNGNSMAAPVLGVYTGTTLPPVITATNTSGCLTAEFYSDGSVNKPGWAAQVSCAAPPAGDCVYVLQMYDSNGNGWGTSNVRVRKNGGAWTSYTVTGSGNTVLIGVNIGDLIEFDYVNTGGGQPQNSYTVSRLGDFPYFTSAIPPVAGTTFSQTVSCSPAPAQPQDCAGAITICGSTQITSSSTNAGQTNDLNASNKGCLSSEHQGTWYYFSPQTNGTIGFSITPANGSDDYDFAVWGPYTAAQCPTGPPLRCSWNAPPAYIVGLGNGATDQSEDAGGDGWVQPINGVADKVYVLYFDNFSTTGQAFQLDWQLGPGTSLDCTVLPVELLELSATARNPVIDVDWATATEHNSDHFSVERSVDNLHIEHIGQVAAAGDASQRNDYRFTDTRPASGVNYYRLLQVDRNGSSALSHVVAARLDGAAHQPMLYPNPVDDLLNVQWGDAVVGMHMVVRDAMGRVVLSAPPLAAGNGTWQLGVDQLSAGCYAVTISMPNGTGIEAGMFIKR